MKFLKTAIIICPLLLFISGCARETPLQERQDIETQSTNKEMNGVFRYSNWGDTIEQVEKAEENDYYAKGEELIAYNNIKLLTYNTDVIYYFDENHLNSAVYKIMDTHTNDALYIEDFQNIDASLQTKYGKPTMQDIKWYSDLLKDNPGLALFMGDVEYKTIWQTDTTGIMHMLSSDNHEIKHIIFYINPNAENRTDTTGL